MDTKFLEASRALESVILDADVAAMHDKDELKAWEDDGASRATADKSKKTKDDVSPPDKVIAAKVAIEAAWKAKNDAHDQAEVLGVWIFQLYGNLLTDEAHQPWEKIVKAQTDTVPQEELHGEVHNERAGKTWTSFLSPAVCVLPKCS